jgi:hypothetical protein
MAENLALRRSRGEASVVWSVMSESSSALWDAPLPHGAVKSPFGCFASEVNHV